MTTGNSKLTITNLDYKLMKACLHFHDCETRFQKKLLSRYQGLSGSPGAR